LRNKLNFNLVKENQIPGKKLLKEVKFKNLVEKNVVMCGKNSLTSRGRGSTSKVRGH
jgi:hypothetical protein